jgi:hypothetical protein
MTGSHSRDLTHSRSVRVHSQPAAPRRRRLGHRTAAKRSPQRGLQETKIQPRVKLLMKNSNLSSKINETLAESNIVHCAQIPLIFSAFRFRDVGSSTYPNSTIHSNREICFAKFVVAKERSPVTTRESCFYSLFVRQLVSTSG